MCDMRTADGSSDLAANVLAEIARQRKRRADVARDAGLSYTALTRRLNGRAAFTVDELRAVARALDVSVTALLGVAA